MTFIKWTIFLNIFLCAPRKKECHTGLKFHELFFFFVNYPFKLFLSALVPKLLPLTNEQDNTIELKLHLWQRQRLSNVFSMGKICFDATLIASSDSHCATRGPTQHCLFTVQSEDQRSQSPSPVIIHPDGNPGLLDTLHLHLTPDKATHTTVFIKHLCKLWTRLGMTKKSSVFPTAFLRETPIQYSLAWFGSRVVSSKTAHSYIQVSSTVHCSEPNHIHKEIKKMSQTQTRWISCGDWEH